MTEEVNVQADVPNTYAKQAAGFASPSFAIAPTEPTPPAWASISPAATVIPARNPICAAAS